MKLLKIFVLLLIPLLFTGCYNKKELDNLAYVIAIGADKADGQNLNITYQIAIPIKIAGEGNEIGSSTFTTYTVTAPSIFIANSKVNAITSKEVNLSHLNLIIYGEELARSELTGHINSLVSNVAIRPKTSVAVCKGTAEDFLKTAAPILETSPARFYVLALNSYEYTAENAKTEVLDFYTSAQSPCKDAVAVIASLSGDMALFRGLAAFSGSKMVGEISPEMTISHLMITNTLKNGTIYVPDAKEKDKTASIRITPNGACKIKVNINNNIPKIDINIPINAHIEAFSSNTDYLDKENVEILKNTIETELEKKIIEYLNKTIEFDSDIAGLGRFAKINYLTFDEFEKTNWKEIYKNSQFSVNFEVNMNVSKIIYHKLPNR